MTVSVKRNQVQFGGDGSTTAFTVNFPYTELDQVKVFLDTTEQTRTTHFTLTDPGATGTVTFLSAPASGKLVTIKRETDYLQAIDYVNNDALDAETLEKAFDKLTMMCQQLDVKIEKSIGFEETVSEVDTTSLKLAAGTADLAGKLLAFDSTGAFVTTQEIGTFKGSDTTTTTAAYVVRDLIRDSSNDNVYFTKQDAPSGTLLTNTSYFELLVDVATVRQLKVDAETAKTDAETAQTGAEAALASFEGQFKTGATNPYSGTPDNGDLWYDTANNILKYYVTGTGFEPVTTSLATVTDNYLTISNQVITAGTVPISLGGTGGTSASEARTLLGLSIGSDIQAYSVSLQDISSLTKTDGNIIVGDGSNWVAESGATARTSLGLGSIATQDSDSITVTGGTATLDALTVSGSSSQDLVRITQTGTGNALVVEDSANPDSTPLVVDANGNVGIGVTPTGKLDVAGIVRITDGSDDIILTSANLVFNRTLSYIDYTGTSTLRHRDKDDSVYFEFAYNSGNTRAAFSPKQDFRVFTGATATQRMIIDSSGNVGIDGNISVTGSLNVSDDSTTRINLGLGTIATQDASNVNLTGGSVTGITDLAIADGGTGASTEAAARSNLLPSYSGNGSKVLALNSGGTDVEWVTQSQVFTAGIANAFEHPNSVTDSFTVSASDHRFYLAPITFSGTITVEGKMLVFDGPLNTTGTINVTGELNSTSVDHAVEHPNLVTTSFTVPSNAHRYYVGPVSFSGTQTIQGKMLIFDGLINQLGTANVSGLLKIRG